MTRLDMERAHTQPVGIAPIKYHLGDYALSFRTWQELDELFLGLTQSGEIHLTDREDRPTDGGAFQLARGAAIPRTVWLKYPGVVEAAARYLIRDARATCGPYGWTVKIEEDFDTLDTKVKWETTNAVYLEAASCGYGASPRDHMTE